MQTVLCTKPSIRVAIGFALLLSKILVRVFNRKRRSTRRTTCFAYRSRRRVRVSYLRQPSRSCGCSDQLRTSLPLGASGNTLALYPSRCAVLPTAVQRIRLKSKLDSMVIAASDTQRRTSLESRFIEEIVYRLSVLT